MDSAWLCCLIPLVIIILVAVAQSEAAKKLAQARAVAHKRYEDALASLRNKPTDSSLRQDALEKGRKYLSLHREGGRITVYDEAKLKNDLDAACAAAPTVHDQPAPAPASPDPRSSPEVRLNSLYELYQKGLISEDEYASKRQRILDDI